eukprot:comp20401_c0_seq1/m.25820 comp20401_c0_seq1/g.25820  ORF comp20401_c0_seq1/g.25820 comp20401_c0_seq1/m.25820 type:complete len:522 (-) comp20401_c0_seq1:765-2330(-)
MRRNSEDSFSLSEDISCMVGNGDSSRWDNGENGASTEFDDEIEFVPLYPSVSPNNHRPATRVLKNSENGSRARLYIICLSYLSRPLALIIASCVLIAIGFTCGILVGLNFNRASNDTTVLDPLRDGGTSSHTDRQGKTVVLLSIDAFRFEYLSRNLTPNIVQWGEHGTIATLTPVFPSKTFPNHYTIVTGLYPESHGIIANTFYDPSTNDTYHTGSKDPKWYGGEPIWCTAASRGLFTASLFWPGSDVAIEGIRPTFWETYDDSMPVDMRIEKIMRWLQLPVRIRPSLITGYFNLVDEVGHRYGPDSKEVNDSLVMVDKGVGKLIEGIRTSGLANQVDLIILSDHGMASIAPDRVIYLDDYIRTDRASIFYGDVAFIYPQDGYEDDMVYNLTRAKARHNLKYTIYTKGNEPPEYHFRDNQRIPPILLVADIGWEITDRQSMKTHPDWFEGGDHGYNNSLPEMAAMFVAAGMSFAQTADTEPKSIPNIEIYNLLASLLEIEPAPNNGTKGSLDWLLRVNPGR